MVDACRLPEGNPGLDLGLRLGAGFADGRDKVLVNPTPGGFGLWVEQLLAESTGKEGKGLVPAPGESAEGPDRQDEEVRVPDPYELGQEFYRWEFATAVAGAQMGINPFDQPNVQEAKDRTEAFLASGEEPSVEPVGSVDELLAQAEPGDYLAVQAFVEPDGGGRAAHRGRARALPGRGHRHDRRLRAALPALDRPAAQGRAAERPLPPGRGRARGSGDPGPNLRVRAADSRAGGRRLRGAARARAAGGTSGWTI